VLRSPFPPAHSSPPKPAPARLPDVTSTFLPGLELARQFHDEIVAPILASELREVPFATALIGTGSDVQGFDTERSTDHGWGPRLQIFLGGEDFHRYQERLSVLLEHNLPLEFRGYPVRFPFPSFGPAEHQVRINNLQPYFAERLGSGHPSGGLSVGQWLMVPTQILRELTSGAVFHDELGLEARRKALAWYPDDVWRYVLACQWVRLDQEEPFVGRCGEVGDELGSAVVAARQVRDLMKLCLLMNRVYPPYSKWLGTAFSRLPCASALTPHLSAALSATAWQDREQHLSAAYEYVAGMHNALGLTDRPVDVHVRDFYDRPFQVLAARRFAEALTSTIADPELRALPLVGAIDQYVDATDVTSSPDRCYRYIAGPGLVASSSERCA